MGIVGPNGAGKTSLVEMIHFGALAYSPRTTTEAQVIAFGHDFTRVEVDAELGSGGVAGAGRASGRASRSGWSSTASRSGPRPAFWPASRCSSSRPTASGSCRRGRRFGAPTSTARSCGCGRPWPRCPAAYARALAQRNHLLRRLRAGRGAEEALVGWDDVTARAGAELTAARERLCALLAPAFAARLEQLGGVPGDEPLRLLVEHRRRARLPASLRDRRRRDIERAATGAGPHLDDVELRESGRDLRRFGSQGEQRRALLALILAEADLLTAERGEQPVLLLDDVTGEFDAERRGLLLEAVARFDQAIVTTTDEADLGPGVAALLRVAGGKVRA